MSSYKGRHADLYDIFYADKPYSRECRFVHDCIEAHQVHETRRLIDVACGTGSHALLLEKIGYEVLGTDHSEDMLAVARRKAKSSNSDVKFLNQDMTQLNLEGQEFQAAVCLFDSIGYVRTNNAIHRVFKGINRHLSDGSLFILEFWHAAAMLRYFEPVRVRRWTLPDRQIIRITETSLECGEQLARVSYDIYELFGSGTFSNLKETQINRYFLIQEMELLLGVNGFQAIRWYAGYDSGSVVDQTTWHIVAVARKVSGERRS